MVTDEELEEQMGKQLDECFSLLNEDEVDISEIAQIINRPKEDGTSLNIKQDFVVHYLVRNIATSPTTSFDRKKAFAKFCNNQKNREYLARRDNKGNNVAQIMVGLQKIYGKDLILEVLRNTDNVQSYKCSSPRISENSSPDDQISSDSSLSFEVNGDSLLDYMICQKAYGEDVAELAIEMMKMGIALNICNSNVIAVLLEGRALQKDVASISFNGAAEAKKSQSLTEELCNFFINEKHDAGLFFELIRFLQKREKGHGSTVNSRSSSIVAVSPARRSSEGVGLKDANKEAEDILKEVIKSSLKSGAINFAREVLGKKESIPAFLLRKSGERDENLRFVSSTSIKLWSFLQAAERINKLTPDVFKDNGLRGNLLHEIIRHSERNISLFQIALSIIKKDSNPQEILKSFDKEQRTALFLACEEGWDNAIEAIFDPILIEQVDSMGNTPLGVIAAKGFRESCALFIKEKS